jgi:hypothetical protein
MLVESRRRNAVAGMLVATTRPPRGCRERIDRGCTGLQDMLRHMLLDMLQEMLWNPYPGILRRNLLPFGVAYHQPH